jgi:peptidoglycan-N-acetylglucosamine deacetylase
MPGRMRLSARFASNLWDRHQEFTLKTFSKKPFWKIRHTAKVLLADGISELVSPTGNWLPLIRSLPKSEVKRIGLSFDDGPAPYTTQEVVRLLADYDAKATFFLLGERASANRHLAELIVEAGHDVFAHGWSHVRYLTTDEMVANLDRAEALLQQYRPTPAPYLVRLPYAEGRRTPWVHRALRQWNPTVQIAHWTYWLEDWEIADQCQNFDDVKRICQTKLNQLELLPKLNGAIILLHECSCDVDAPLNPLVAPQLLKQLLDKFSRRGFAFVPVIPWPKQPMASRFFLY